MDKISQWSQRILWPFLLVVIVFFGVRLYYRATDDFGIANMTYEMPFNPDWKIEPLSEPEKNDLHNILNQPFTYVGKGAQSYAFISADQKYVIKFFKFKHLKPSAIVEALPDFFKEYREKKIARKERLLNSVFSGYKLAYDRHREESGTIFIHLNRTNDLNEKVTLVDKIGRKHLLDLDPIVFVVQERAVISRHKIAEALDAGDLPLAKKRFDQIIDLYLSEYSKGIYDRDHGVMHNTGFVGEKPIHLDVGKLTDAPKMKEPEYFKPDLEIIGRKFKVWIRENYPQYESELVPHIHEKIAAAFGNRS